MKIRPFALEKYFAKYEFSAEYLLSSSDCDGLAVKYLLQLADPETKKIWEELKLGYTESLGLPQLRQEISKLIIVNFPHNPTGSMVSKEDFQRVIDIAKERNIYLFSDEMYRFLEYRQEDRLPSAVEIYDKAITLFGISKTFGMAGVRIGWIITKDNGLYKDLATFKDYTTICSSAPSEILSLIGLRARDKIIKNHLVKINYNRKLLDVFFKKHKDIFS